jgi:hypothetical protein
LDDVVLLPQGLLLTMRETAAFALKPSFFFRHRTIGARSTTQPYH